MTFAGKLFVMLNLAISLLMAVGAFGLFATNLDYDFPTKGKDATPQPPARITALAKTITEVLSTAPSVEGSYTAALTDLLQREDQQKKEVDWYYKELVHLRTGADAAKPARAVSFVNNLPVAGADGDVLKMDPVNDLAGQPLLSLATYNTNLETARKDNLAVLARIQEQLDEDIKLTNMLIGTPEKKGLRQLLIDERDKRNGIVLEINSVRPLFINTAVESELIRKRYDSMQERIQELKNYLRKKHHVDVALRSR